MFFRREKPRVPSFSDRLDVLRQAGFSVKDVGSGRARISRGEFAAIVEDRGEKSPKMNEPGMLIGSEIGLLTHGGYQMFFVTPTGVKEAALAQQLRGLHDFREDLIEALGDESYYNEALGTIAAHHMYDRVEDRDQGGNKRVWES